MTKQMIEDLKPGEPVDSTFMVVESSLRSTRNGGAYLDVTLSDRTGQINCRMWDATEALAGSIQPEEYVVVKGRAESYKNKMQINIRTVTKADSDDLRLRDFLKQSARDPAEMWTELTAILARVEDEHYRALIDDVLADEEFCQKYRTVPAAVFNHHAYLGGLLEHTLSMMGLAVKILEHYTHLNADRLLTGIFFHDAGKTRELACARTFKYTTPGRLVGHIMMGVMMVEERSGKIEGFPDDKRQVLQHLILSHHGQLEFGSPKVPMCAEAWALHYIDNFDAKLKEIEEILEKDGNADPEWTDYARLFNTALYKG